MEHPTFPRKATIDALPFSGENHGGLIGVNDSVVSESHDRVPAEIDLVSTGYLEAMGVRLIRGEWFHEQDMKDSGDSVIVNDIAAQTLVFRQGFLSALIGLVSGLALALTLMRVLQRVLVGISSDEFSYLWIEAGTVILAAALACWVPARRASRIDPAVALRQE
jgi:hypothetical protein